jgi:hypothetical protein
MALGPPAHRRVSPSQTPTCDSNKDEDLPSLLASLSSATQQRPHHQQQGHAAAAAAAPALVVTACPRKRFSKRELETLAAFVREGRGSLLVCLEEGGEAPLGACVPGVPVEWRGLSPARPELTPRSTFPPCTQTTNPTTATPSPPHTQIGTNVNYLLEQFGVAVRGDVLLRTGAHAEANALGLLHPKEVRSRVCDRGQCGGHAQAQTKLPHPPLLLTPTPQRTGAHHHRQRGPRCRPPPGLSLRRHARAGRQRRRAGHAGA